MAAHKNQEGKARAVIKKQSRRTVDDIKKHIAQRATVHLASLPNELTGKALTDSKVANFMAATRKFLADCTAANSWSAREVAAYARALELTDAVLDLAVPLQQGSKCGQGKRICRRQCDIDNDNFGCYLDCHIEYLACVYNEYVKKK